MADGLGVLKRSAENMKKSEFESVLDALAATQVSRSLPGWFLPNAIKSVERLESHDRITFSIFRAWKLDLNETWEVQSDGTRLLVSECPERGKQVAISVDRPDSERLMLFTVDFDRETGTVQVSDFIELSELRVAEIHLSTESKFGWPSES